MVLVAWMRGQAVAAMAVAVTVTVVAVAAGAGCGRTELDPGEPCQGAGTIRACVDTCGAGTQRCQEGYWTTCLVPPASRACTGVCGQGIEMCVDRKWGTCEIPVARRPCTSACGNGVELCTDSKWGACDAPQPKPPTLHTVVRDLRDTHPDFEKYDGFNAIDVGIVAATLGPDDTPIYAGGPMGTETTSGPTNFNQWYHDVPGVNAATTIDLPLTAGPGRPDLYVFEDREFFPIDGQLFGNQGHIHNYHFTLEAHTRFRYLGGETFSFSGDDDMWVFINRRLAIDLGGIHDTDAASVDLDGAASRLQIFPGQTYQLDIFFAERHTTAVILHPPHVDRGRELVRVGAVAAICLSASAAFAQPDLEARKLSLDERRFELEQERFRADVNRSSAKEAWEIVLPLASVILTGGITFVVTRRVERRKAMDELAAAYDQELRKERIAAYKDLWKLLEPFALYVPESLTYQELSPIAEKLRKWYFETGGLFLSASARDRYFGLIWAIGLVWQRCPESRRSEQINAATLHPRVAQEDDKKHDGFRAGDDLPDLQAPDDDYRFLRALGSRLRTALSDDVRTRFQSALSSK